MPHRHGPPSGRSSSTRGNLLAHGVLARQYVVIGEDAALAQREWRTVLDHGGAIVWTATLYDVDTRSYFLMAFDREALRVYRFGELAGKVDTRMGMPQFPGADRERLWRAWGGCIDAAAHPKLSCPGATSARSRPATGCCISS